ncbi:uncharacterized protein LOC125097755 isoform X2 [Lutra lutra]|uniref:uncharacterized protein LOC125097755 isoform X2 n=1 Tax=Lutra lutra TaxID=9657 RepID=UPI001FD0654D|nr:uncharacterized protein LOC125097755 isoform X2 [Lutra lutra]
MSPHTVLEPLWAVLEQLWAAGLVIYERSPHEPRVSGFGWEILVCTAVVLFITVKCGLSLRRRKGHCAQNEVSGKDMEKTDPDAQACGAVASSEQKASPLPLQILALAALNQDVGFFSVENATQLVKGLRERLLKSPHQLTDENPVSGAAQDDGEPPARKMPEGSKDSPDLQGSADPLVQDIGSCGQRVQEEAGEAGRPELPDGGVPWQAPSEGQSQHHTLSQILLKVMHLLELLRDHLEGGGSRRQVETGSYSTDHVPSGGSPLKKGKPSRALKKARQGNEELPRNTTIHQAEQVSFHLRNTLLESEIQKLRLKLEAEPELCEEHIKHLERKMTEEKARCLQVKNELAKVRRKVAAAHWNLGLYKKMADDLHREWQKISSLHDRERLLVENRSEESQKAVLWAERAFQRLKEENHCLRQKLANSGPKVQPVPGGPPAPAPALPGTASKYPQGPKAPLKPQKPKKGVRVHWPDCKFSGPLQV